MQSFSGTLAGTDLGEGLVLAACRMDHGLGFFVKLSVAMGPVELWKPAEVKSCSYFSKLRIHWPEYSRCVLEDALENSFIVHK